jgi:dUTP pyrophosphatase
MNRDFEKISFEQFKKDVKDDRKLYDEYSIPQRDSDLTAGYDILLLEDITIKPNEIIKIPTGLKSVFNKDEVLLLVVRSSMGFKYNIRLCNQVGVIDADYYNNPDNEGHIALKLINHGNEEFKVEIGDRIAQGIFVKYLVVDDEEEIKNTRKGGFGSTGKKERK